jgi:hypothetical protein
VNNIELFIHPSFAKVDYENKVVLLSYGLFHSGTHIGTYEKSGERFLNWLVNNPKYNDYKIAIDQSSEPLCNAGFQSQGNKYFWNYKRASKIFKTKPQGHKKEDDETILTNN